MHVYDITICLQLSLLELLQEEDENTFFVEDVPSPPSAGQGLPQSVDKSAVEKSVKTAVKKSVEKSVAPMGIPDLEVASLRKMLSMKKYKQCRDVLLKLSQSERSSHSCNENSPTKLMRMSLHLLSGTPLPPTQVTRMLQQ